MKKLVVAILFFGMCATGVKAQELTVFPSTFGVEFYQDLKKLKFKEVDALMMKNTVTEMHWKKSKKNMVGGMIFGAVNFGAGIWAISNEINNKPITQPMIAFGASALIGSFFANSALKNKKMAILKYNDSVGNETSFYLVPEINANGIGLALKF